MLLMTLMFSCSVPETEIDQEKLAFFDLAGEIELLANKWNADNKKLEKTVQSDLEDAETKIFSDVDWLKELKPFLDADINKKDWFDKFEERTDKATANASDLFTSIKGRTGKAYYSLDDKIKIKRLFVSPNKEDWNYLEITLINENPLYYSESYLSLDKVKAVYNIKAERSMIFSDNSIISISGKAVSIRE